MAKKCKQCTEQGKNLKPIIGKKHSFQMDSVVEPNAEVLPDELIKDAYILVTIVKWPKLPTAKSVSNTTADVAINFMPMVYFK